MKNICVISNMINRKLVLNGNVVAAGILSIGFIWLCLTRTGNYQIREFDWLKLMLLAAREGVELFQGHGFEIEPICLLWQSLLY